VIGSGSVVSGTVPPHAIAAGNPANVVGERPDVDFVYVPGRGELGG
jgi:acetyltransferase-like isoleucine patch superfamily enzyme